MTKSLLDRATLTELVDLFVEKSLAQYQAELRDEHALWNRLYRHLEAITLELKIRPDDQRRELVRLYSHSNAQVCVNAALATLAVAPAEARAELQNIATWPHSAQRVQALDMLDALAGGVYVPT